VPTTVDNLPRIKYPEQCRWGIFCTLLAIFTKAAVVPIYVQPPTPPPPPPGAEPPSPYEQVDPNNSQSKDSKPSDQKTSPTTEEIKTSKQEPSESLKSSETAPSTATSFATMSSSATKNASATTHSRSSSSTKSLSASMPPIVTEISMVGEPMLASFESPSGGVPTSSPTGIQIGYVLLGTTYDSASQKPAQHTTSSSQVSPKNPAPSSTVEPDQPPLATATLPVGLMPECVLGDCTGSDEVFQESSGKWADFCTQRALGSNTLHAPLKNSGANAITFSLTGAGGEPLSCGYSGSQSKTDFGTVTCAQAAAVKCSKPPNDVNAKSICSPPTIPTTTSKEFDSFALCVVAYRA